MIKTPLHKYESILKYTSIFITTLGLLITTIQVQADEDVGITRDIFSVTVKHQGEEVKIERNQDPTNTIEPDYTLTSRACPPFCVQPARVNDQVETIEEIEIIDYLKKKSDGDDSILVMDSRTPDWVAKGTIPGSVNVPWTKLNPAKGATSESIVELITGTFGAKLVDGKDSFDVDEAIAEGKAATLFDFSKAKTLIFYCNGIWCGQSPTAINTLIRYGYPEDKMKWYRGGMQSWHVLGLTVVKAKKK